MYIPWWGHDIHLYAFLSFLSVRVRPPESRNNDVSCKEGLRTMDIEYRLFFSEFDKKFNAITQ